ncbi:MAG: EpsI family protein [Acidobacteriaceae bacterium]|nr:EpsI family protein [Acidobacteriaceae bacterium]MBV9780127.1 EpsI family protein [Acidobacteriaceae bacterium]
MAGFLHSRSARVLSVVLLAQAALFYGLQRRETIPAHRPLEQFSLADDEWVVREDLELDKETLEVLKADDILSRLYQNKNTGRMATLFIAYFETQRTGKTPHSPKNCLPGTGWVPSESAAIQIPIPGEGAAIHVNRYVVSRGQNQSVVLYWYQARDRVIASEYSAKLLTVADAIRYNRSDTALVRVVVGVENGDARAATASAVSFVQAFFEPLRRYLPA